MMKLKSLYKAVLTVLGVTVLSVSLSGCDDGNSLSISTVEFVETVSAPSSSADMSKTLATAKAEVTYSDGSKKEYPLSYNTLFSLQDKVGGNAYAAGQLYNYRMQPLMDVNGQPLVVETPDGNSLLNVDGSLYLITHLEYDWLLANGTETSNRAPMGMILSGLEQAADGKLSVKTQKAIDFSSVGGTWINCAASQTPWNTHLGSEEDYDLQFNPLNSNYSTTVAGLKAMTGMYFDNSRQANPYDYGFIPEVTVKKDGSTSVVKHYAMGRGAWEMTKVMADGKTAYLGDDGSYTMMAMFVADKSGDLSSGTLYAAKWNQTSDQGGGTANLIWYKLGKANDTEIRAIIDSGVTFNSIWDAVLPVTDASGAKSCSTGYTRIRAGSSSDECLKLRTGMEKAAAFLETRRYAAYLGATTEFTKMEAIAANTKDKKAYMAMSYIQSSMKAETTAPVDHIKVPENKAGATFTLDLAGGQQTANGSETINSDYVATRMYVEAALLGKPISTDAYGNTADVNAIANPDNVFFSEKMRTLFIGEDSGNHVNNYVWAYNVDTRKLTRILSSAAGAENTGLQVLDNLNGYAYIMSNNQHWGDLPGTVPAPLKADLQSRIDRFYAPVGYISGLPGM